MRNTILIAVISLLVAGCSKDKFSSRPQLKYESVNTKEVNVNQSVQMRVSFTDLEGDLQDSIYVEKVVLNCPGSGFKLYYPLPVFPSVRNSEGEIILSYTNGFEGPFRPVGDPQCDDNDTCYFRFVLQDEAKQLSDTVNSDVIVIYK